MSAHMAKRKISGFTVCVVVMYASAVAYILFQAAYYLKAGSFLPSELTLGFFAVFCTETHALMRLSLAKRKDKLPPDQSNAFVERLGLYSKNDFEAEISEMQEDEKGKDNGQERLGA